MALKNHIEDLITAYKAKPNSEWRNKVVSHLKDAYASAVVEEMKDPAAKSDAEVDSLLASGGVPPPRAAGCTCPGPGVVDHACPIHHG